MTNVTWRRFDQSAKQRIVGHTTIFPRVRLLARAGSPTRMLVDNWSICPHCRTINIVAWPTTSCFADRYTDEPSCRQNSHAAILWVKPSDTPPSCMALYYYNRCLHGRPHTGGNGVSWPYWKMEEKLKRENMQKRAVFYIYVIFFRAIRAGRCRERRYAGHIFYSDILQNAPFRSQIFLIFFASGGKRALTPLPTKILRTLLDVYSRCFTQLYFTTRW